MIATEIECGYATYLAALTTLADIWTGGRATTPSIAMFRSYPPIAIAWSWDSSREYFVTDAQPGYNPMSRDNT